jgi:acyl carrier protein
MLRVRTESGASFMTIGNLTPPQATAPLGEWFSIKDIRSLVAQQFVDVESVTSETHFTKDLGADLFDRVELMLAIEDQFVGVEITLRKGQRGLFLPISIRRKLLH